MRKTFTLLIALMALSLSAWAQAPTVITWDADDLATISLFLSGSKSIDGVTVTASCVDQSADYVHFNNTDGHPAFSMRDGGSLTFAPESGLLTSIVIEMTYDYEGLLPIDEASGWVLDDENSKLLKWTGSAASVVLKSNSSEYLVSGPITSIAFTVSGFVPTSTSSWEGGDLTSINVGMENGAIVENANSSQELSGITITANAPAKVTEEDYNYSAFSTYFDEYDSNNNSTSLSVYGKGSLTFAAPEDHQLKKIVITCQTATDAGNTNDGWIWDENTLKLTWTGDAASSVDLTPRDPSFGCGFMNISSIVFTLVSEEEPIVPDTREVIRLTFGTDEDEDTMIRDMYNWLFVPGTDYTPSYSVYVRQYVNEGTPYEYFSEYSPSELELPIEFSLSNDDVLEINQVGNSVSFNAIGYGDVVLTASTPGNEVYAPASKTLTLHVVPGKGPNREGVLAYAGTNGSQLVPEGYKFEMQTGDEIPQMELREKNYPQYGLAPCHAVWGSEKYYVACLEDELKLRALTAGDDYFTVRYSRYEDGDADGNFLTIRIPVHITSSQPAMTSALNLSTSPASNPNMVFNATYDAGTQSVQVAGTLTTAEVKAAMEQYAYGSQAWKDALPNTMSFELPAGQGSFEVTGQVQSGYELRVIIRGEEHARVYTNTTPETHVINYDIDAQKAVVIYVAVAGSANAPRRAPATKKDAPLATLSALAVEPTYPITSNVDPDHSGIYYTTFYDKTQKYLLPAGTEAYAATISGEEMILEKVAEGGQVIPANNAYILKSTSSSVVLTPTDEAPNATSATNILHGTDTEMAAPANCYVLSGHSTDNSVTGVGFYEFSGTLAAHKAYATISGGAAYAPKKLRFVFNGENAVTGIDNAAEALKSEKRIENGQLVIIKNGVRYNAQGQIVK